MCNHNIVIRDALVYDPLSHFPYVYSSRICLFVSTGCTAFVFHKYEGTEHIITQLSKYR